MSDDPRSGRRQRLRVLAARRACVVAASVSLLCSPGSLSANAAGGASRTAAGAAHTPRASRQPDDEAAVGRLIAELQASAANEAPRTALRRLISREPPPSKAIYQRVQDAFRAAARAATETLDPPSEPGPVMHVDGRVTDPAGQPIAGALLYVFHADSTGWYARDGEMDERHPRLFAFLRTDAEGRYAFRTARPGGYRKQYGGRFIPQHIHFEVTAAGRTPRRFQLVFRDDPRLDEYWLEWARTQGNPVAEVVRRDGIERCVLNITLT